MVSIKRGKKKESSAPVVTIPQAQVKLVDVEFHPEPQEFATSDGKGKFTVDPGLNAQVVVLDDMDNGKHDGLRFWQRFKLKWKEDEKTWELRDGTALGALVRARFGDDFDFESDEPFDFKEDEFEGFEFLTKIVPKKNPATGQLVGSMCHHETILRIPDPDRKKKKQKAAQPSGPVGDELDLTPEEIVQMNEGLG